MIEKINEVTGSAMVDPSTRQKVGMSDITEVVIEQIDTFSAHVEGLGITSRFIPAALVEICRELVADSSPEEVDRIENIISRVIESARARF